MKKIQTDDINSLIQNYQNTNRLLLNRSIVMAVLFILIFGIQSSTVRNEQKRKGLNDVIYNLAEITHSNNIKQSLDSIKFLILWDYYRVATDAEIEKLDFELSKTGYKDSTPIYELIGYYEKQLKELGLTSKDYQISVFGLNSSFSTWFYFAPIILLLLYHDMTRTILYRASLRRKIKHTPMEYFKVGSEIFGSDKSLDARPTNRFMYMVTNLLVTVLIFLPLIPVFIAAISYISENRQDDINGFMVFIQWVSPLIMTIELIIIYYTENLLGMRKLVLWIRSMTTRWPRLRNIYFTGYLSLLITAIYVSISYAFKGFAGLDYFLIAIVLLTTAILPVSSKLLLKYPDKYFYRGVRLVGRMMIVYWLIVLVWFVLIERHKEYYGTPDYPKDTWLGGVAIVLFIISCIAIVYIWVFSSKYKRLNRLLEYWKEKKQSVIVSSTEGE